MSQTQWENLASWISIAVALAVAIPMLVGVWLGQAWPGRWVDVVQRRFGAVAGRTAIWMIVLPAMSFGVNGGMMAHREWQDLPGVPRPLIHDEFSYLLAGDTFAHGRVTNPSPKNWQAFETPQELMRPSYMSKYPPGQGIALAVGQLTAGEPIVGVWLATATACAAVYWMMLGFESPKWALVAGWVAVLCPELVDWSQVYWGGSVAVLGGALLVGAWGRLMIRPSAGAAVVLAIALVILGNSRPYEGLVLSVPLLILLVNVARKRPGSWAVRRVVPATLVLLVALAGMGWYNLRITGSAMRMPFAEYSGQYDVYPKFWFLPKGRVPEYRNEAMRWVHTVFEKGQYERLRTPGGLVRISWDRLCEWVWWTAKPAVLMVPLAAGVIRANPKKPRVYTRGFDFGNHMRGAIDIRIRWLCLALVLFLVGLWAESFLLPHYAAPALPVVLLLIVVGWKQLANWRGSVGRVVAAAVGIGFLAGAGMIAGQPVSRDSQIMGHAALAETPQLRTGRHLIFVRYAPGYVFHNEYVFNDADLSASRIVWARSLGPVEDRRVMAEFPGRAVWRLSVGEGLKLTPILSEGVAAVEGSGRSRSEP